MGKGIAVKFRDLFGHVKEMREQRVRPGGVAFFKHSGRFI
jgi:hypothetical protein